MRVTEIMVKLGVPSRLVVRVAIAPLVRSWRRSPSRLKAVLTRESASWWQTTRPAAAPCLQDLVFQYPLHNFLHYQVNELVFKAASGTPTIYGDLLASVRPGRVCIRRPPARPSSKADVPPARPHTQKKRCRAGPHQFLRDAHLTDRIISATKENDAELEDNNGVRRGYMGHLMQLTTELLKVAERSDVLPSDVAGAASHARQCQVQSANKQGRRC